MCSMFVKRLIAAKVIGPVCLRIRHRVVSIMDLASGAFFMMNFIRIQRGRLEKLSQANRQHSIVYTVDFLSPAVLPDPGVKHRAKITCLIQQV